MRAEHEFRLEQAQRVVIQVGTLILLALEVIERVGQSEGLHTVLLPHGDGLGHLLGVIEGLPGFVAEPGAGASPRPKLEGSDGSTAPLTGPRLRLPWPRGPLGLVVICQSYLHKAIVSLRVFTVRYRFLNAHENVPALCTGGGLPWVHFCAQGGPPCVLFWTKGYQPSVQDGNSGLSALGTFCTGGSPPYSPYEL